MTDLQTMLKMYAKVGIKVMTTIDRDEGTVQLEIISPAGEEWSQWMHFDIDTEDLVDMEAYR